MEEDQEKTEKEQRQSWRAFLRAQAKEKRYPKKAKRNGEGYNHDQTRVLQVVSHQALTVSKLTGDGGKAPGGRCSDDMDVPARKLTSGGFRRDLGLLRNSC